MLNLTRFSNQVVSVQRETAAAPSILLRERVNAIWRQPQASHLRFDNWPRGKSEKSSFWHFLLISDTPVRICPFPLALVDVILLLRCRRGKKKMINIYEHLCMFACKLQNYNIMGFSLTSKDSELNLIQQRGKFGCIGQVGLNGLVV